MTNATLPTDRYAERDFRIGHALSRALSVLSRNFLPFFGINVVAVLPVLILGAVAGATTATQVQSIGVATGIGTLVAIGFGTLILMIVLQALSQAVVLYGAFQDMLGRQLNIGESLRVGLSRFFPIIGVAICVGVLAMLASFLLLFPAFILATMWFVAPPACVVERLGPLDSMGRSRMLTKGHRWPIFGIWLLLVVVSAVVSALLNRVLAPTGVLVTFLGAVIWNALFSAFYSIFVVVTYHDLRVAKEGVDTEQIASVFE
jgi:hypothetical protein